MIGASVQWMIFMIAAAIAAPIGISDIYSLNPAETALFMQRTIFVLGVAGLIQAFFGHKLPIHEGPAGLWWSVFTIYAGLIGLMYTSNIAALQALSGGMLISGFIFIILALFGIIEKLANLFTPTVTFIYLLLLVLQLSGSFIKGMFGLSKQNIHIDPVITVLSFITILCTFMFGRSKIMWLRQFSVIFALAIGWLLFILFDKAPHIQKAASWFTIPKWFAFGAPHFDGGSITTAFFLTFLLITNLVASVRLMENIIYPEQKSDTRRYRRGGFISGINQILGGTFAAIGPVPISGAAGFVAQTGEKRIQPFLIGCFLTISISFLPQVMNIIAALPVAVGYAVTFVLFANMLVMALNELKKINHLTENRYLVIGISLLTGVGIMFLPGTATANLPSTLIAILNNGLIVGSVLGILLEQYFIWRDKSLKIKEK